MNDLGQRMHNQKERMNWHVIAKAYRTEGKPLYAIARQYGVPYSVVVQRAKREMWLTDLKPTLVPVVTCAGTNVVFINKAAGDQQVVGAAAKVPSILKMDHTKDIARARQLLSSLFDELEQMSQNSLLFKDLGELLEQVSLDENSNGRRDRLRKIYHHVISLPGRIRSAGQLMQMLERLNRMERDINGNDKENSKGSEIDRALLAIAEMKRQGIRPS